MSKFWKDISSSSKHAIEFCFVFLGAYLLLNTFQLADTDKLLVTSTVISFFVKLARTSDKCPLPDYVNSDGDK